MLTFARSSGDNVMHLFTASAKSIPSHLTFFLDYLVVFDAGWLQYLHLDLVVPLNFAHGVYSNSFSGVIYCQERPNMDEPDIWSTHARRFCNFSPSREATAMMAVFADRCSRGHTTTYWLSMRAICRMILWCSRS
jgi:hypothetical protein